MDKQIIRRMIVDAFRAGRRRQDYINHLENKELVWTGEKPASIEDWVTNQMKDLEQRPETRPHETVVKRPTDIKDRNGRMIFFGDTVRFVDKVEWYRGAYWAKVARGVMTREEALKEIEEKPYEERIVEDAQDYGWLLKSEIQTYWEVVDA